MPGSARHHPYYFDATDGEHFAFVGFGHSIRDDGYIKKDIYRSDPIQLKWSRMRDFPEARVAGTEFSVKYADSVKVPSFQVTAIIMAICHR